MWGVQVKLGDLLRTCAIPVHLTGVFTMRCYKIFFTYVIFILATVSGILGLGYWLLGELRGDRVRAWL